MNDIYKKEYREYRTSFFGGFYNFLIAASFIIAALTLAGVFDYVYDIDEKYFTVTLHIFIVPFLLLLPRYFYFQERICSRYSIKFLKLTEIFAAYIYIINEAGSLYFFKKFFGFDNFAHISTSLIFTLLFLIFYFSFNGFIEMNWKKFFMSIAIFLFLSVFFEVYEKYNDAIFGTKMFYDPFQPIRADVTSDMLFNSFGIILGASIFFLGYNKIKDYLKRNFSS